MNKRIAAKLGALACGAALASCMAVPAFAAEGATSQDANLSKGGTTNSDVILKGTVAKEGTLITVTVPANIPFSVSLDDANSMFKGLTSPTATISNAATSNAAVKVSVASVDETTTGEKKLLSQMTDLLLKSTVNGTTKSVDMTQFSTLTDDQKLLVESIAAGESGDIKVGTSVTASDNLVLAEGEYTVKAVLKIDAIASQP